MVKAGHWQAPRAPQRSRIIVVIVFVNEVTDGENDAEFVCESDDAAAFTEIYKATLGNIEGSSLFKSADASSSLN